MEAVHRYEGTVNQIMGDGIMALVGGPLAQEDHAVPPCYAALCMRGAREDLRGGTSTLVGRSIGSDLRMDYNRGGPATHLAARTGQIPGQSGSW